MNRQPLELLLAFFFCVSLIPGCATAPPRKANDLPPFPSAQPRGYQRDVDIVPQVDLSLQVSNGPWIAEKDRVMVMHHDGARLTLPGTLTSDEYDVSVEFTRYHGNQGFGLYLTTAGRSFLVQVSAVDNQWVVLNDFQGESAKNPTKVRRPLEPNGQRQRLDVKVRRPGVMVFIDEQLVLDYKTDFANTVARDWGFGKASLGLVSWYNVIAFHSIKVNQVESAGKD